MAKTYYVSWPTVSTGDPRPNFGLAPTFVIFSQNGSAVSAPSINAVTGATGIYSFTWGTTTPIAFLLDGFTTSLGTGRYISGSLDPADSINETGSTLVAIGTTSVALGTTAVSYEVLNNALGTSSIALGTSNLALGVTIYSLENILWGQGITSAAFSTSLSAQSATILSYVGASNPLYSVLGSVGSTFGGQSSDPVDLFGYLKRVQENLEGDNYFTKVGGGFSIYNRGSSTLLRNKTVTNSASQIIKTGL